MIPSLANAEDKGLQAGTNLIFKKEKSVRE
jgi:hypothetical protein